MKDINKVIVLGRVGQDPQLSTVNGTSVARFSVATKRVWKDQSGEKKEATEWHNAQAWGKLADIIAQYVTKGSIVYVEGDMRYGKYTDKKTGVERYTSDINVSEFSLISAFEGKGGESGGAQRQNGGAKYTTNREPAAQGRDRYSKSYEEPAEPEGSSEFADDDLPF